MRFLATTFTATLSALLLAACGTLDPKVEVAPVPPPAAPQPLPVVTTPGSIYQGVAYRPLFEDYRARLPGDTITILIVERISASARSTSSVDKAGEVDAGVVALPGINSAKALNRAAAKGSSTNTFSGKGATESSNNFSGTVTAVVTGVLPNGHLLIAGEKQIGVNANVDVLRFSGQVDPRNIQIGNTVPSAQIANVRLEQRSVGQQGEAQSMGWLARFFLNVLPI
jgi:flagellar L-ring protein precursor FlgH